MGCSGLPVRRASWRCVGTVLESLMTPLLLLWSCYAQYGVILPTTLRGMSPHHHASASSSPSSSLDVAAVGATAGAEMEDILVWARHPVLWGVLGGVLYGVFFVLAVAHYLRVVTVDNCPDVHPCDEEAAAGAVPEAEGRGLTTPGAPFPRCPKCDGVKPARCHHCSQCQRCCLKMDHHCPWMGNCIGFYNYKFFLNFLVWTTLLCTLVLVEAFPYFLVFLRATSTTATSYIQTLHISILGFVAAAMLLSVFMLLEAHIGFVLVNTTTLESHGGECRAKQTMYGPYDLGRRRNWLQVYGPRPLLWFLPVFTSLGDGYTYPRSPNYVPPSPTGSPSSRRRRHHRRSSSDNSDSSDSDSDSDSS